jgi:hypothetical protein
MDKEVGAPVRLLCAIKGLGWIRPPYRLLPRLTLMHQSSAQTRLFCVVGKFVDGIGLYAQVFSHFMPYSNLYPVHVV